MCSRSTPVPRPLSLFDAPLTSSVDVPPAAVALSPGPMVECLPSVLAVSPSPSPSRVIHEFTHPAGSHDIVLGDMVVRYVLARGRRRSIGMVVSPDGLSVRAPRGVHHDMIEAALHEKSRWIRARLVEQRERGARIEASRLTWADGVRLPFLGRPLVVRLDVGATGVVLESLDPVVNDGARCLRLGGATDAGPETIRHIVQTWLRREALQVFEARIQHFSALLGVSVQRLSLSAAQTRWGSATLGGHIRLNWRLIHLDLSIIDYVVAHELAHLRFMDHSPQFWAVVREVIPDVETRKARLKDPALPLMD